MLEVNYIKYIFLLNDASHCVVNSSVWVKGYEQAYISLHEQNGLWNGE
jgi:hypothetical protein